MQESELMNLTGVRVWVLQNPWVESDIQVSWTEPYEDYEYVEPFEDYDYNNPKHTETGLQKAYWKECMLTEIKTLGQ